MTIPAAAAGAAAAESEAASAAAAGRTATASRSAADEQPRWEVKRSRRRGAGGRALGAAGVTGSRTNYQAVILGEFILAVLAVLFPPIARKNTAAVSPYSGLDMIQIAAITVVYFFLALLAGTGGQRARFSAWFGGLIMLGVGLGETANLTSIIKANNATAHAASQQQENPTVGGSVPSTSTTTASGQPSAAGTTGSSNG